MNRYLLYAAALAVAYAVVVLVAPTVAGLGQR